MSMFSQIGYPLGFAHNFLCVAGALMSASVCPRGESFKLKQIPVLSCHVVTQDVDDQCYETTLVAG